MSKIEAMAILKQKQELRRGGLLAVREAGGEDEVRAQDKPHGNDIMDWLSQNNGRLEVFEQRWLLGVNRWSLIFAASPPLWTEMRKFTVRTLREFGFGKIYTMHSVIITEVNLLADEFRKKIKSDNGVVKFRNTFSLSVLNVLWCMVAGIRYEHDDPRLLKLMGHIFNMSKSVTFGNPLELMLPFTKKFAPWLLKANLRNKVFDSCHELSKTLIEERKAEGFYLSGPQNYIDVFLKKIHDHRDNNETVYTEQQLQAMLADLLMVGSLTLNATLNYGILFLTLNPEIQKKCQNEIDSIVPRHNAPTVDDIEKMPYFQAFMLEMHRCANVVPNPVPRLVPKDWNLRGYRIPKDTVILTNHYSVNTDEKIWGDPRVFRPERFINEKGEFVPDPRVVVFGFGKRICIGINLVNSIVPLFLGSLLQQFNFSVVPGTEPPSPEPEIGVSLSPQEFPCQLIQRESPNKIPV
ncbi:Methyl farnesoate epoxidase [Orchesella cincta]|uniref:Methyl farnesoate epoxidase n=1 Tax=Orchesella cincta TaxID=48709 RepID=A0A1D2MCC6_ORCCI|nr:Methyl farnesoate epoxidase [Orchesella cincta]